MSNAKRFLYLVVSGKNLDLVKDRGAIQQFVTPNFVQTAFGSNMELKF